jgi:hypothetical protein
VRATKDPNWTAVVAGDAGVGVGTADEFLNESMIGWPGATDEAWALAEIYIPYGDAGYYPSLVALLNARGAVTGFGFWVGAGGE